VTDTPKQPQPDAESGDGHLVPSEFGDPEITSGTVADAETEISVTRDRAVVRRAPRYGRFITLGALVGAVVALILTFAFSGQPEQPEVALGFDRGQVFGFLLLLCATVGAALGAAVALLIDRVSARRARSVAVVHESTHHVDE